MTSTAPNTSTALDDGLTDAVAIVTGGARGNGEAQAKVLANAGATVIVADVLADAATDTVTAIEATGGTAEFVELDVTDPDAWAATVSHIEETYGGLDVVVNNAAIPSEATVTEETVETWNQVIGVNLTGVWLGMKHTIPLLIESGGGTVVNISSIYGVRGGYGGGGAAYQATKGAITVLTKNAMQAYAADGVRVNSVHPGFVETPMTEGTELLGLAAEDTPQERLGTPEEVAHAVYFLASDFATYVNGSELYVDGGWSN